MAIFYGKRLVATRLDSRDQVVAEGEISSPARGVEMEFWPHDRRVGDIALKPPTALKLKGASRFDLATIAFLFPVHHSVDRLRRTVHCYRESKLGRK